MVSSSQSSVPPIITVIHEECREQISLRQIAKDLNVSRANVRRAKNWLIENCHPAYTGYIPDSLLNPEQAKAIITYRDHTAAGIRGDTLTEKMFPPIPPNPKKNALRDLFAEHNFSPEQAAQLTHQILRIFNS